MMQTPSTGGSKKRKHNLSLAISSHAAYANKLSFYNVPPIEEISVDDFESMALDRIKVLKEIDNAKIRGLKPDEYNHRMEEVCAKHLPLPTETDEQLEYFRDKNIRQIRKDVISHFILRLAYCRPADRNWFLKQEVALLKHRLRHYKTEKFLEDNGLKYEMVADHELVDEELSSLLQDLSPTGRLDPPYFKVEFEKALELVKHRKVLLRDGWAYVPRSEFASIIAARYRAHLADSLAAAFKAHSSVLDKFDSIAPILSDLSTQYLGQDYVPDATKRAGRITIPELELVSVRSFPLCMRKLYGTLKEAHHLKHGGRMQLGLFLKGIGLTLEDALTFWRHEFTKLMAGDKFDKSYAYNIRHNYGKEGRRTDYTPYSCLKIIMGQVGPGESHGCPFRHFDADNLRSTMIANKIPGQGIEEVLELVRGSHYQIACRRYFELTHPSCKTDLVVNHPNQYFDESEKYFAELPAKTAT
eukprot:TRINITY_DN1640_c0_g2_i6.p1 TRINITY_DN1640_c0_g2~~TRINITY_DN1640_c0_g2_i6.p1  ORF type:complete len:487 (-),score=145.77 TRINITY_DN1640_c0_g2_i6:138-1550(-)